MKFGVCTKPENLQAVIDAGYDYIELALRNIAECTDEEFKELKARLDASPVKAESTNVFFSLDIPLVGPQVDLQQIREYLQRAFPRAAALGIKVCVMGNGGARNVPDGFDRATAEQQLAEILRLCGESAKQYGITVALEPLRVKETNLINTVAEGIALCRKVDHPNVKVQADFYHVLSSGETLEAIENAGAQLAHVHLAVTDRKMPVNEEGIALCQKWAAALRACNYDGRISLEGKFGDDFAETIRMALPNLKRVFNKGE